MKRDGIDVRLLSAVLDARTAIRQAVVLLTGRNDPTVEHVRLLLGSEANRLTVALKNRSSRCGAMR